MVTFYILKQINVVFVAVCVISTMSSRDISQSVRDARGVRNSYNVSNSAEADDSDDTSPNNSALTIQLDGSVLHLAFDVQDDITNKAQALKGKIQKVAEEFRDNCVGSMNLESDKQEGPTETALNKIKCILRDSTENLVKFKETEKELKLEVQKILKKLTEFEKTQETAIKNLNKAILELSAASEEESRNISQVLEENLKDLEQQIYEIVVDITKSTVLENLYACLRKHS